jgi:hypothetical protein
MRFFNIVHPMFFLPKLHVGFANFIFDPFNIHVLYFNLKLYIILISFLEFEKNNH